MSEETPPAALVPGAHRVIRILDPHEGAFAGDLVCDGDEVRVRADADDFAGHPVWAFSGADHVAAPVDLVRRADGMDVLLPWCTERVETFVARRTGADVPLGTGECVTLVGSLLRGLAELGDDAHAGTWWLTDGGRPMFVLGDGAEAGTGAATVVARLGAVTSDRGLERVLTQIEGGLQDMRAARRRLGAWEDELTQLAAPQPLRLDAFAPAQASEVSARRRPVMTPADEPVPSWARLREHVSTVHEAVRETTRTLLRRVRASRSTDVRGAAQDRLGRRRPMLLGAAVAVLVLTVGVLWPTGDADEPAVAQTQNAQSPDASPAPTTAPKTAKETAAAEKVASTDDAVSAAPGLLEGLRRCLREKDAACADSVAAGSAPAVLAAISDPDGDDAVRLVESYGDIAVIGRRGSGDVEQMLVLLRQKDEWLVRDVYDVANQPGSS